MNNGLPTPPTRRTLDTSSMDLMSAFDVVSVNRLFSSALNSNLSILLILRSKTDKKMSKLAIFCCFSVFN